MKYCFKIIISVFLFKIGIKKKLPNKIRNGIKGVKNLGIE